MAAVTRPQPHSGANHAGAHRLASPHQPLPTGRHSLHRLGAVPVGALLEQAIRDGRPLWLDWPDDETSEPATVELPVCGPAT